MYSKMYRYVPILQSVKNAVLQNVEFICFYGAFSVQSVRYKIMVQYRILQRTKHNPHKQKDFLSISVALAFMKKT